jgi:hypothetical protein
LGLPITNITIVGGGTAGWIAAAYLNYRLQWGPLSNRVVTISVIESPTVGVIGVGEATVPLFKSTMNLLGISEAELIQRVDATFKLGITFDRWNTDRGGKPVSYLHPFTGGKAVCGCHPGYSFKKYGLPGQKETSE